MNPKTRIFGVLALMAFVAAPVFTVGLSSCATRQAIQEGATPAQAVFAIKADYNALLGAAVQYESLPRCGETTAPACSDKKLVKLLRKADTAADSALDGAEAIVRTPGISEDTAKLAVESAKAALETFRTVIEEIL